MLFKRGFWMRSSEKILNTSEVFIQWNGLFLEKDAIRKFVDMFFNLIQVVGWWRRARGKLLLGMDDWTCNIGITCVLVGGGGDTLGGGDICEFG